MTFVGFAAAISQISDRRHCSKAAMQFAGRLGFNLPIPPVTRCPLSTHLAVNGDPAGIEVGCTVKFALVMAFCQSHCRTKLYV